MRRGRRSLQRMALDPKVRRPAMVLLFGGSGFLLSGAGLGNVPQPLAMGMITAATGWRALVMSLGAMAGYPAFWGSAGNPGIVWAAAAGLLALLLGKREEAKQQPLMIPAIAAMLTAVTVFVVIFRQAFLQKGFFAGKFHRADYLAKINLLNYITMITSANYLPPLDNY